MTERSPVGAPPAVSEQALVVIRAGGATLPLVCVHAEAGHLRLYENLAQHLDPDQPVYGLRGVGRDLPPHAPYRSFEEMARRYVLELSELGHSGPYLILGECDGGELAYELAQQLHSFGEEVTLLALVDSFGPGEPHVAISGWAYRRVNSLRMLAFHLSALTRIDARDRRTYVVTRLRRIVERLRTQAAGRDAPPSAEVLRQQAFREAKATYRPTPYPGRVVLFRGARLPWGASTDRDLGWGRLVAGLEITELPAYFGSCMLEPVAGQLAEAFERAASDSTVAEQGP